MQILCIFCLNYKSRFDWDINWYSYQREKVNFNKTPKNEGSCSLDLSTVSVHIEISPESRQRKPSKNQREKKLWLVALWIYNQSPHSGTKSKKRRKTWEKTILGFGASHSLAETKVQGNSESKICVGDYLVMHCLVCYCEERPVTQLFKTEVEGWVLLNDTKALSESNIFTPEIFLITRMIVRTVGF